MKHTRPQFIFVLYYIMIVTLCVRTRRVNSRLSDILRFMNPYMFFFDLNYSVIAYRHLDILTRLSYKLVKHYIIIVHINPRAGEFRWMEERNNDIGVAKSPTQGAVCNLNNCILLLL